MEHQTFEQRIEFAIAHMDEDELMAGETELETIIGACEKMGLEYLTPVGTLVYELLVASVVTMRETRDQL